MHTFLFYCAVYIGMFDLTIFNTSNSIGQIITFLMLLFLEWPIVKKKLIKPLLVLFSFLIVAILLLLYHDEGVYHYTFILLKTSIIFFNIIIISFSIISKNSKEDIANFIIIVFFIQALSLALYSNEYYQLFRNFFLSARSSHLADTFGDYFWYRDATLSNQGYSGYALGALPLVLISIIKITDSKLFSFNYIISVIACGLGIAIAMINGRSIFLFIPLYILYLILSPKEIKKIYKILPVFLFVIILIIIILSSFDISKHFVLAFFEEKNSSYGIESVNDLMTNHTTLHFDVTLFGLGQYMNSNGKAYVLSDIGFYRQLAVGGIFLVIFYISICYMSLRLFLSKLYTLFPLFIILLSNFKQEAFNNSMLIYGIFLLSCYLVIKNNKTELK
ncbi:hypothetical protein AB7Y49_12575 [Providencia vermicola]|uniref:hypothetical protein n=1 Tax=Providencia TaxID=586 RepID=UPI00234B54D2|nr:hypothetical protein [Providencia sp. PROV089]